MRVRALGVAAILFGLAGMILSYVGWFVMYRLGTSAVETADIEVACRKHCGFVDGRFLIALIASGVLTSIGLLTIVAGVGGDRSKGSGSA